MRSADNAVAGMVSGRLSTVSLAAGVSAWLLVLGGGVMVMLAVHPNPNAPAPSAPPPGLMAIQPILSVAGYAAIALAVLAVLLGHLSRRRGSRAIGGLVVGYVFLAGFLLTAASGFLLRLAAPH